MRLCYFCYFVGNGHFDTLKINTICSYLHLLLHLLVILQLLIEPCDAFWGMALPAKQRNIIGIDILKRNVSDWMQADVCDHHHQPRILSSL